MMRKSLEGFCLYLTFGLLASGCGGAPVGNVPAASPVSVVDTISPEAQQFYAHPPKTFISIDSLPLMLRRMAISKYQDDFGAKLKQKYGPGVTVEKSNIAGVPVLVINPPKNENPAQVLLDFHGGGFVQDSGSQTETIPMAALTGRTVIAVLYRLAPENPYPAALEDCLAVYRKLLEKHAPHDIIVFGTSAGATLTAQIAVRLKHDGTPMPAALGMFSMISDFSRYGESMMHLNPLVAAPSEKVLHDGQVALIKDGQDAADPMLSPLFADLHGLPPILLMTGSRDLLMSQTTLMHRALIRDGVDAQLVVFEGMWHAHWAYLDLPESKEAFEIQARFFRTHFAAEEAAPSK